MAAVPNSKQPMGKSPLAPSKPQKSPLGPTKPQKSPPTNQQVDRSPKLPPNKKLPMSSTSKQQRTPKGTTSISEPRGQLIKTPKDEQAVGETLQDTPKTSKIIDKKRKLGTKSRLSVRTTESSTEAQDEKKAKVADVKPESRDRRNARDQRTNGRGVKPARPKEEPQRKPRNVPDKGQADSKCKAGNKHRTSSFAILGVLGDDVGAFVHAFC